MPDPSPLLKVDQVTRQYTSGWLNRRVTFSLAASFEVATPRVIGVLGPNGSGKTTLFELITGSNRPCAGRVLVKGQDIHSVRTQERDRLAIHYHQSYQVRSFKRARPDFMLAHATSVTPWVHLFDEPQFNLQDGYVGFMLDFFQHQKEAGRLVFLCMHPNEPYHVDILRQSCDEFLFVHRGEVSRAPDLATLMQDARARSYLGVLATLPEPRFRR